jgi:hypothetical protein
VPVGLLLLILLVALGLYFDADGNVEEGWRYNQAGKTRVSRRTPATTFHVR